MSLHAIAYLMHEAYLRILRLTQLTCQQAWQAVHEARKHYCYHDAELQQQQVAIGCLLKPDKLCTGQEVVQKLCAPSVLHMCLRV